jgi:hypothetical protein
LPANTSPVFTISPVAAIVEATAANTNRDGTTGTYYTLVTGATNGTRIDRIVATATGTTAAGMLRFFLYNGTLNKLMKEIATSAVTPSGTVAAATYEWVRTDGLPLVVLPSTYQIRVSTHNAETWEFVAFGGDY